MPADTIAKVSYTHDAMIDLIIARPQISQGQLAQHFGYTQGWICQVMSSDAWKVRLAARRDKLVDPVVTSCLEERLEGLAMLSVARLQESLDLNPKPEVALKVLEISTRALGYGVKAPTVEINHNYVVALPEKAATGQEWEAKHGRQTIDVSPV